ncbi:hypothetical protein HK104_006058 [Borealophlyctis nickersoniae]|nr:hypothetical protein HK104_006058 [Borealophlyctis nickersoniae]
MTVRVVVSPGSSYLAPDVKPTPYFNGKRRLFSVQVQGRFKREWGGDDVLWGVVFEKGLPRVPIGAEIGVRIAKWADPALEIDLHAVPAYSLAPILSAMQVFNIAPAPGAISPFQYLGGCDSGEDKVERAAKAEGWVPHHNRNSSGSSGTSGTSCSSHRIIAECTGELIAGFVETPDASPALALPKWEFGGARALEENSGILTRHKDKPMSGDERMKYVAKKSHRDAFTFTPDRVYAWDFYNKHLDLAHAAVRFPGVSISLAEYWTGEPLTYAARNRDGTVTFFAVSFELAAE